MGRQEPRRDGRRPGRHAARVPQRRRHGRLHALHRDPPDPALEGFLTDAAVLSRNGRITKRGIPKGVTGWLQGAVMLDTYGEMVEMSFPPAPPRFLQRLLMPRLARLAKRRGIRPGNFT